MVIKNCWKLLKFIFKPNHDDDDDNEDRKNHRTIKHAIHVGLSLYILVYMLTHSLRKIYLVWIRFGVSE